MNFTPLRIRGPISTTALPKPSVQTTFILNAMAEEAEKEGTKLDQILESIDLLFTRVTDIGLAQQWSGLNWNSTPKQSIFRRQSRS